IACCAATAWPNSVSAPAVTPSPTAGAALSGGAGRGPAAACAGEGRVGANLPPPLAGAGRGGGAAGGLCGVAAGPPPCPPPEVEGENPRSSRTRGEGGEEPPPCPPPEAEGEGSGLGGATVWLRRTSSATAA